MAGARMSAFESDHRKSRGNENKRWSGRNRKRHHLRRHSARVARGEHEGMQEIGGIALSTLKTLLSRSLANADAREPVMAWFRQVEARRDCRADEAGVSDPPDA